MGRRGEPEIVAAIYQAFVRQRTWRQAELAEHLEIASPTARKWLDELTRRGLPLERQEEHPNVFWSVPPGWIPGGVVLSVEDATALMRHLLRLPRSKLRERLLRRVLEASPAANAERAQAHAVVAPTITEVEEGVLPVVEDSVMSRRALAFRYYSAGSGTYDVRSASVQRLVPGPPARVLAVCHRDDKLKWFRLERMSSPRLESSQPYREAPRAAVEAVLGESVDGFHAGGEAVVCVFIVTDPEARWVRDNLPSPMTIEPVHGGVRVSTRTAGVLPLARFVVGLGGAARAETPELARAVEELASGALRASTRLNDRPAIVIDSAGLREPRGAGSPRKDAL